MNKEFNFKPEEFSLVTVYKLIKFKFRFFLIFVILFTSLVIAYSYIMPYSYLAGASILPPKKEGGGGAGLSSILQNFGGIDIGGISSGDQSKLFSQIITSRTVCEYIVAELKLRELEQFKTIKNDKLYDFLKNSMSLSTDKSGIIFLSTIYNTGFFPNSRDKEFAAKMSADMANTAIKGLDKVVRERNLSSAHLSKNYIETQLVKYKQQLDSVSILMKEFQEKNKVISLDEQAQAIVSQAVSVGSELAKAELEYNLAKLEFNNNSSRVKIAKEQFDLLNQQYKKIQSGGITGKDAFSIPLDNIPSLMKDYADIFRQRKILEQVILYLETQHHQEAIQEQRDIPIVEVLDYARIPDERNSPNRIAMVIVGFVVGILLAIVIIVLRAFIKGKTFVIDERSISSYQNESL